MHRSRFIPILVSAILSSLAGASAADKIDGFAKLTSGDTLHTRFTSGGCFHFYTYDLTFTRTPKPTVSVVAVRLELDGPDPRGGYRDAERRELGKVPLSESDLAGLDALLAFYRTNSAGGCTTYDGIKISQIHNGKVIATEQFIDASCKVCAGKVKGVLSIDSFVQRLPKRKDRG
jgi:hypothetical protein